MTPDHIIRTKRVPLILSDNHERDLEYYVEAYETYYETFNNGEVKLDAAPRWAVWPGQGTLAFGASVKNLNIIKDITRHTKKAIHQAEHLAEWTILSQKDLFEVEYWSLEQAKLKRAGAPKAMQGRIALVTGAASGIGKACVESLLSQGAVVTALDINPEIASLFPSRASTRN